MNYKQQTTNNKLSLGFSPCPNDTFMFDAMVHGKIDTEGLLFDVVMEDVEALNQRVLRGDADITKVSFAAFTKVTDRYQLLDSGSALGNGVGPLLVSKISPEASGLESQISGLKVAIPGNNTTAHFLFSFFFPQATDKVEMIFSEIEDAVLTGKADAGVIIHENRFTYESKGLKKICDLGELWERETQQPIPLGGIAVKRNLPGETKEKINRVMRRSVQFAFANPSSSYDYVKQHAQEMDEEVRKKHIDLYVNKYSVDLGAEGRKAIETFFEKAVQSGIISSLPESIFLQVHSAMPLNP
jgi:1,4-dihydroxy-6-naphthoate synthase